MDEIYLYVLRGSMVPVGHMTLPIKDARNLKVPVDLVVIALDGCTPYYGFVIKSHCRSLWQALGGPRPVAHWHDNNCGITMS